MTWLRALAKAYGGIYLVNIDGIYGTETEEAVRNFQIKYNLPDTGVVDYKTWCELFDRYQLLENNGGKKAWNKLLTILKCHFKKR